MNVQGRPVTILGAAKSGLAAAKALVGLGARVFVSDLQPAERLARTLADAGLPADLAFEGGGHTDRVLAADFIVLSPGVPTTIPILQKAQEKGIPIHSEIEIAYRLSRGRRLVVTGSNGKTTTTTLLAKLCEAAFPRVFLGGNIGIPMMEFAAATRDGDLQVLEVSSFQLETISSFTPDIAIITNFFENHLDRYPDYASYCQAKERIAMNMGPAHWLILNAGQPVMQEVAARAHCRTAWFGWDLGGRTPGVTIQNDFFVWHSPDGRSERLFPVSSVGLIGRHNRENVMAASAAALLAGVPPAALEAVIRGFRGVEHRLERVRALDGVAFINDSKGTNCAASITAMNACEPPMILIAGGRDKGTDLTDWVNTIRARAKGVVLYGEAKDRFRSALEGLAPLRIAASFPEAVRIAFDWAAPGDTVLLSPACSSYDLFPNFEVRGATFKELVAQLAPKGGAGR